MYYIPERFKIDICEWFNGKDYSKGYSLSRLAGRGWLSRELQWRHVGTYNTREEAKKHYEEIKDLPEFLR